MLITDIKRVVDQVSREKGISRDVLISTLKEAVESAARKKLGARADIEVHYDEKTGEVDVFQFKEVVEDVQDPDVELTLEDGLAYDPECEMGDALGIKVETESFGRIAAQSAKQVIIQKMKEAEKKAIYENYIHKKGEIINGIVQRVDRGNIVVNLGQADAVLTVREQIPRENYRRGDRIRAYVLDVLEDARGSQIILSRTHPEFLVKLFATEVPEIAEAIVSIRGAAREPGVRSKIAVSSSDPDVDPVGACVGMKGNRVQNIVQELRGEKIDIVQWNPDVAKFVCNALAPAEISRVIIDEDNKSMEIIVVDDYLSIAIGKNGQNVRLACRLTGWHLEVMSEDEYSRAVKQGYDSLMEIPGVNLPMAEILYKHGYYGSADVAASSPETVMEVAKLSFEDAQQLIADARITAETAAQARVSEAVAMEAIPSEDNGDAGETTEAGSDELEPLTDDAAVAGQDLDETVVPSAEDLGVSERKTDAADSTTEDAEDAQSDDRSETGHVEGEAHPMEDDPV